MISPALFYSKYEKQKLICKTQLK